MTQPTLTRKEEYLRYIENCLFFKGGRWIANFDVAIRNFNISKVLEDKKLDGPKRALDLLIFGGVKGKGFILSRAFAFLASPTYVVSCAVIDLQNSKNTKWTTMVSWLRYVTTLMEKMEFEWSWILFFGNGKPPDKVIGHLERFNQRKVGMVYVDLKNNEAFNSDGFIGRRGSKLFHPKNMEKRKSRLKFWSRS